MNGWTVRTNASTLASAKRHREIWTSAELEFLTEFVAEPIEELAHALGRTYLAVAGMKHLVLHGEHAIAERNREVQARADQHEAVCPEHFLVLSATGACAWC